jgi:transposase
MGLRCKRCGGEEHVKNGLMRGHQRYLCKSCGLNFTDTPARGKPLALKAAAVLLYVSGLSMNRTAKLLGVSTPTIQAWLEQFAAAYAQKPEPEGRAVVIELDEMWHYLKKSQSYLYGPGMRWCGLILNGAGSLVQASQMAWNGVRHRSAFRCLAKL